MMTKAISHATAWVLTQGPVVPGPGGEGGAIPDNLEPTRPPQWEKFLAAAGLFKTFAGIALLVGFFAGLAVWAGGRWADNHRAGRAGTIAMLVSVSGGLLYAIGPAMINWMGEG